MFGRTTLQANTSGSDERKTPLAIQGIPQEFYGGANPVVEFKTTTKEVDITRINGIPVADQKAHTAQTAVGGENPLHPVHFFSDSKKMTVAALAVVGMALLGSGGYYWFSTRTTSQNSVGKTGQRAVSTQPTSTEGSTLPTVASNETTQVPPDARATDRLVMPSLLLGDTPDDDRDLITNQEEGVYRSDPGVPDSDDDSYPDAHELYYLYSPTEKEPSRLVDSGNVAEYSNPTFGYQILYPSTWLSSSVDPESRDVLFTSLSGEYVEIRVFDRSAASTFAQWLVTYAPQERTSDLARFITRTQEPALVRQDYLVYYFQTSDNIYALVYHPSPGASSVTFRTTLLMMARSFKADKPLEQISVDGVLRELGKRTATFAPSSPETSIAPTDAITTPETEDAGRTATTSLDMATTTTAIDSETLPATSSSFIPTAEGTSSIEASSL